MTLLKLCGLCLLLAVLYLLQKEAGGRFLPLVALSGGVVLMLYLVEHTRVLVDFLGTLTERGDAIVSEALSLALRVLGLSFLTELTASLCRDMGEGGLATRLEWCGRLEILVVSLPLLCRLLDTAFSLVAE